MLDTIIIGGGITGAYTGYLLASQGISSCIIERNNPKYPAASSVNPGGINPLHGPQIPGLMSTFSMHAYHLHQQHWKAVHELSELDFNPRIVNRLILAFSEKERAELLTTQQHYAHATDFSAQYLSPAEITALDPRVSEQAVAALLTTGNATVDAKVYTSALLRAAEKLGAKIDHDEVMEIKHHPHHVEVVLASGATQLGRNVIVTTGAWSNLFAKAYPEPPVFPIKGELLWAQLDTPFNFDLTWKTNGLYHHADNYYWLGGTQEKQGFDYQSTQTGLQHIQTSIATMLPRLGPYRILKHCVAMRPGTSDGLPIIGRQANTMNIWIATGSGCKGILWSAGIADLCIKMLTQKASEAQYPYLSPQRFAKLESHHEK